MGPTPASLFIVVTIDPRPESATAVRSICPDLAAPAARGWIPRYRGGPLLRDELWIGGMGPAVRRSAARGTASVPRDRRRLAPRGLDAGRRALSYPSPSGRIFCFELATQIMSALGDAVSVEDEVHAFRYFDNRDLLGFVDGTENPVDKEALDAVLIRDEDPAFAGGSYVIVQKYLHDLAGWNALPTEAPGANHRPHQGFRHRIGRRRQTDLRAQRAQHHRRRRSREEDLPRQRHLRPARAQASSAPISSAMRARRASIEQMLENMFVGRPPGNYDRILDFSRAVTGSLFFAPSASFLDSVTPAGTAAAAAASVARSDRLFT